MSFRSSFPSLVRTSRKPTTALSRVDEAFSAKNSDLAVLLLRHRLLQHLAAGGERFRNGAWGWSDGSQSYLCGDKAITGNRLGFWLRFRRSQAGNMFCTWIGFLGFVLDMRFLIMVVLLRRHSRQWRPRRLCVSGRRFSVSRRRVPLSRQQARHQAQGARLGTAVSTIDGSASGSAVD